MEEILENLIKENNLHKGILAEFMLTLESKLKKCCVNSFAIEQKYTHFAYISQLASNFISNYDCPFIIKNAENPTEKIHCEFDIKNMIKIADFIYIMKTYDLKEIVTKNTDAVGIGEVYKIFMENLYVNLMKFLQNIEILTEDDRNKIYYFIENYICSELYENLFPEQGSEEDISLQNRCKSLCWIRPEQLDILGYDLSYGTLKLAVDSIF